MDEFKIKSYIFEKLQIFIVKNFIVWNFGYWETVLESICYTEGTKNEYRKGWAVTPLIECLVRKLVGEHGLQNFVI